MYRWFTSGDDCGLNAAFIHMPTCLVRCAKCHRVPTFHHRKARLMFRVGARKDLRIAFTASTKMTPPKIPQRKKIPKMRKPEACTIFYLVFDSAALVGTDRNVPP